MKTVTLDALILREDFEITSSVGSSGNTRNKATLSIEDIKYDSFFFAALRKPIFQRETNEWDKNKVFSMIESFINSDLIPALILWRNSGGYIFVIDGAHRLSSLGAWINDDYGDGEISLKYYGNVISPEQKKVAETTREIVNEKIGSFKEIWAISRDITSTKDVKKQEMAKNLGALAVQLQWVEGDAIKAEDSFLKINQSATKISDAELDLIMNREKAYAISARAIVRAGKGYQYWSNFNEDVQMEIVNYSKKIHNIMFGENKYNRDDINSYTIAGIQSSSMTLDVVTQTVKICNGVYNKQGATEGNEKNVVNSLKNTLKILEYINSNKPFSLGIHPYVFFYSDIGKHKVGSYYGFLMFTKELVEKKKLDKFTRNREKFEQTIYKYSFLIQQIIRKKRQSKKAYSTIRDYFNELLDIIDKNENISIDEIVTNIKNHTDFNYLQMDIIDTQRVSVKSNFSRGKKQQIKLQSYIKSLPKCSICGGYLSTTSMSVDHIIRKEDGGNNSRENAQLTHLYCNTTYKN
ncbi:HNH endonuclease family protein [Helicovermis profundi]|uniref:HNH nuclease domain-containing protein n=1 Tax=Helicovermis profundi TaxID=3065157 RepID=A0AAU9ES02_9FIRM|nr:hypothetical protein HLPR_01610 [Clostridia bacterium S502]